MRERYNNMNVYVDKIKKLMEKEMVRYVIAGGLTTAVNLVSFFVLRLVTDLSRSEANVIAIMLAILFAYFTNRNFVFESKSVGFKAITREIVSFFACRIFSMVIDALIYFVGCTLLKMPDFIVKFIGQVVVIILNYVFSKLIVFKKKN